MRVLIWKQTASAWEQFHVTQFSFGAALHVPLDEFGTISRVALFSYLFIPASPSIRTIGFFGGHCKVLQTSPIASLCQTRFALPLGGKCQLVSSTVLWPHALPVSKLHCVRGVCHECSMHSMSSICWAVVPCRQRRWGPYPPDKISSFQLKPSYFGKQLVTWENTICIHG